MPMPLLPDYAPYHPTASGPSVADVLEWESLPERVKETARAVIGQEIYDQETSELEAQAEVNAQEIRDLRLEVKRQQAAIAELEAKADGEYQRGYDDALEAHGITKGPKRQ